MSADVSAEPASVPLRDLGTIETIETIRWKRHFAVIKELIIGSNNAHVQFR